MKICSCKFKWKLDKEGNALHETGCEMKKYQIIYADPPWQFTGLGSKGIRSGAMRKDKPDLHRTIPLEEKYPTLSNENIKTLPISGIADKDCVLFLWTTDAHLPFAIEVMRAWGFEYATIGFTWLKKTSTGKQVCYYGYWTLKGAEICLIGRKGKPKVINHKIRQLVEAKRREHSRKPDEVRKMIVELMGDIPRIELFARQKTEGWDVWGNEVENSIELN
jgi:N6-adenosine-specific RNA methylase IME4